MQYSFFTSRDTFWKAWLGGLFLLTCIYILVSISAEINTWYGQFYNLLQKATQHEISEFWEQMWIFAKLAFFYILVATISGYFGRIYAFWWRTKITFDAVELFRNSDKFVTAASQRIQEDSYRFAKIVESLGIAFLKAILTIIVFTPLLYNLSKDITIPFMPFGEYSLLIIAFGVSLGGLIISWFVGWFLPGIEYDVQNTEAAFRKECLFLEDRIEGAGKPETILQLFTGMKLTYKRLFNHYAYFDVWINFFEQFMVIIPYLLMAPALFTGAILLGGLVQISNAFSKIRESLSVLSSNWTTITELRSIHKRLAEFEKILKS